MKSSRQVIRSASFSRCGTYRYVLTRRWNPGRAMGVIGLNPSTADGTHDDPTIRRCIGIARGLGFGSLVMTNVFAYRSTDPRHLRGAKDPVGPGNRKALLRESARCDVLVAAWGNHCPIDRARAVCHLLQRDLYCFATNQGGQPAHPLYLPSPVQLKLYCRGDGTCLARQ